LFNVLQRFSINDFKKNTKMINEYKRLAAVCRRFQFEAIKSLGIFWLIEKMPWLKIKEPWKTLYERANK